jgi:hypothetical protein
LPDDGPQQLAAAAEGPFRRVDNEAFWLLGDPGRWRERVPDNIIDALAMPVARRLVSDAEREIG